MFSLRLLKKKQESCRVGQTPEQEGRWVAGGMADYRHDAKAGDASAEVDYFMPAGLWNSHSSLILVESILYLESKYYDIN